MLYCDCFCCSFPDQVSIVCPPPDAKAKKSAEYVESKGVLAEKYDVLLHFAIAHASCGRRPATAFLRAQGTGFLG